MSHLREGDRVTYTGSPLGAYATERVMAAEHLITLPDAIAFETAASMTMRGLTSAYLLRRIAALQRRGHGAAARRRGRGRPILTQWARLLGINVIGTVSTRREGRDRPRQRLRRT